MRGLCRGRWREPDGGRDPGGPEGCVASLHVSRSLRWPLSWGGGGAWGGNYLAPSGTEGGDHRPVISWLMKKDLILRRESKGG